MREERLIARVKHLISDYKYDKPFALYLSSFFREHREMGGRDRRETRELCFNFFRIGSCLDKLPFENRLGVAVFLCCNELTPGLLFSIQKHTELPTVEVSKKVEEKIEIVRQVYPSFNTEDIFPFCDHISSSIDRKKWCISFLHKPRVWVRIRKGFSNAVINEFRERKISFEMINDQTLSLMQGVKLEDTVSREKGYFEIQDRSSQQTVEFFKAGKRESWWDACAGSGGKSLLLAESVPEVKIFATDVRQEILENYKRRLRKSGFESFETSVCDVTKMDTCTGGKMFDGIIADVPCSGSGTWAGSPEWLVKKQDVKNRFIPFQREIVKNALKSLKPERPLVYITCSVFVEENEENVRFFTDNLPLKLEKSSYIEGYTDGASTLFAARFIKTF
jgi:16S rRNA (cytosine967-C5)-methyltransferase